MRALVFETASGGHFLQWAGQLARAVGEVGVETTLALSMRAPESPSYEHHIMPLLGSFRVAPILPPPPPRTSPIHAALDRLRSLRMAIEKTNPDRLYLPSADGLAHLLGLVKGSGLRVIPDHVRVEALILNGAVAHSSPTKFHAVKTRLSFDLARRGSWHRFYDLNPLVREWELSRGKSAKDAVRTMPEPVEPSLDLGRDAARRHLGLPIEGRYAGMVGRLDGRKGVHIALAAFQQARLNPSDRLVLVGPVDPSLRTHIEAAQRLLRDRLVVRDEVVSDHDLLATLAALDLVLLPYQRIGGSSGVLVRAAAAMRPVLVSPGGYAAEMVRRFDLGWTLPEATVERTARSLEAYLPLANEWTLSARGRRFVGYNTISNFAAHWTESLREELGHPAGDELVSWEHLNRLCS